MKHCTHCALADWKRTAAGKLHPSGDGKCLFEYKLPVISAAMYWIGGNPRPSGGYINRRKDLTDHCTESLVLSLAATAARGERPPMTAWESYQLLRFWLVMHGNAYMQPFRPSPKSQQR